eukprot:768568-Hanusia_phi.AAC.2
MRQDVCDLKVHALRLEGPDALDQHVKFFRMEMIKQDSQVLAAFPQVLHVSLLLSPCRSSHLHDSATVSPFDCLFGPAGRAGRVHGARDEIGKVTLTWEGRGLKHWQLPHRGRERHELRVVPSSDDTPAPAALTRPPSSSSHARHKRRKRQRRMQIDVCAGWRRTFCPHPSASWSAV